MPQILPGGDFTTQATGFPAGLVGTVTVQLSAGGVDLIAPTTIGITEDEPGTYLATLAVPQDAAPGTYHAYWDAHAGFGPILDDEPVEVLAGDWRPSTADVARLLVDRLGRAIDDNAVDGDDFSTTTNPTKAKVEEYIDVAVTDVTGRLRVPVIASQNEQARNTAAYWASVHGEMSF